VKADKNAVLYGNIQGQGVLNIYPLGFGLIPIIIEYRYTVRQYDEKMTIPLLKVLILNILTLVGAKHS
jgi:hypothetical protein